MKLIAIVIILSICSISLGWSDETVTARGLQTNVKLIGFLGKPLGELTEITCRGISKPKGRTTKIEWWKDSVEVIAVDGKSVSKPIVIRFSEYQTGTVEIPEPGKVRQFVGYESGRFSGTPNGTFKHVPAVASVGYGFSTYFVALKEVNQSQ